MRSLANWTPRLPITAPRVIGKYVSIEPLRMGEHVSPLWDALGGNDDTINERLQWFGLPELTSEEDLKGVLSFVEDHDSWRVNVFRLQPSGQVVGMASYIATAPEHGSVEVGFVAHGASLARTPASTEAHYLLAKHCFETMDYRRYEWKCDSNNAASRAAAGRLGFQHEGLFRQHRVTARNTNRDTSWFSMLDSEWPLCKKAMELWLNPQNFDEKGCQRKRLREIREECARRHEAN